MKLFLISWVAVFMLSCDLVDAAGLTSAEYQARIREATERYRGDFVEGHFSAAFSYYEIDPVFQPPPFRRESFSSIVFSLPVSPRKFSDRLWNLAEISDDQSIQLTTVVLRSQMLFDDLLSPGPVDP